MELRTAWTTQQIAPLLRASPLTVTALVRTTRRQAWKPGAHPRNDHPGLQKSPIFHPAEPSSCPPGRSFPRAGSSAAPAAARRGRPGPAAAAADGGEGRRGAGGPPARLPPRHPGRAGRPPACLPASLRWVPGALGAGPAEPELDPRSSSRSRGQVGVRPASRPRRASLTAPSRSRPPRGAAITRGGGRRHPGLSPPVAAVPLSLLSPCRCCSPPPIARPRLFPSARAGHGESCGCGCPRRSG